MWPREGERKTLGKHTHEGRNFKEMLTYDKPCVCVLCVCVAYMGVGCTSVTIHTHTHSEWHTSFLAMLVMFFLFLAQIEFPVPDSAARGAQQHNSLYPGAVSCPHRMCNTDLGSLFWSGACEALIARGGRREWEDRGRLVNIWRIWNCQVIVMLCHRFKRIQKRLLAEGLKAGKGKRFSVYMWLNMVYSFIKKTNGSDDALLSGLLFFYVF